MNFTLKMCCFVALVLIGGYAAHQPQVGQRLERRGDEIVIAGQYFHTDAPVVLWTDPGGYDAYRTERRFAPWAEASFEQTAREAAENKRLKRRGTEVDAPARYGIRFAPTTRSSTQPSTQMYTSRTGRRQGRPTEGGSKLTPQEFEKVRGGGWPLELLKQKVDQFVYHYDVAA